MGTDELWHGGCTGELQETSSDCLRLFRKRKESHQGTQRRDLHIVFHTKLRPLQYPFPLLA